MSTLAEYMIVADAENRPPMLDKTMYNSWESRMLLYIKGKKNGRMMLESIENGPLVYPIVEEGQIRKKKYAELNEQEKLQDDYDVQATNIVLQGLPPDVYALFNHCSKGSATGLGVNQNGENAAAGQARMPMTLTVMISLLSSYDSDVLSELNKLAKDFGKRFVPHKELYAEQAFWLSLSNPISEQPVVQPTTYKQRPKTTPDVITEGSWGFEHIKAIFKQEAIPFIKTLRDLFKDFNNGLHSELNEVKTIFNQMEVVVEQCSADKRYFDIQKKEIFLGNDRLLEHIICQDVMNIVMSVICVNSLATLTNYAKMEQDYIDEYNENLVLKAELAKKEHMVEKNFFDEVVLRCSRLENRCVNLELKLQHQKESFLNKKYLNNQDAPEIQEFLNINEWQTKLNAKDVSIANLRKHIESVKGENVVENDLPQNKAQVIAPGIYKLDLELLSPNVLKNRDAHIDYIKHTRENADILRELVEHLQRQSLGYGIEGKSKKHTHKPKSEDSIQEKLYLLHMDLCGPMRIQSINGWKYILVIVDNYSRFTWVKFLRSKDEVPEFVIKFLKMIQVCLNAIVRNIRIDNGTKFVNQTLRSYYEDVGITHQNHRLLALHIRTKVKLLRPLVSLKTDTYNRKLNNNTPYELLHNKKPNLPYFYVFGALYYSTNDSEDLGKLKPKADIGKSSLVCSCGKKAF
ncbi:retrovirus-related pol polyprotein from transposon TNT 1-94 [Tanacetum coccineum]